MEKKRKLRGKWLLALGALLMAVALGMLQTQPSVLQYCIIAPQEEATANYVPAAAVIRRWRALSGFTGRKGSVGGLLSEM